MTKFIAKSASRALGFLICKDKALGGIPFKCFTKYYNSLVQPVIDYGSSIWGTNGYSCVEGGYVKPCLSLLLKAREICSNPCCGRGHGMVSTTAQTMAPCNEKMVQDVMYGQLFFDKENFYALKESIQQFLKNMVLQS